MSLTGYGQSTLNTDDIVEEVATADSKESIPLMYEDRLMDKESKVIRQKIELKNNDFRTHSRR